MQRDRIYFRNLNAVRFLAAGMVFVHHTEQIRAEFLGLDSHWNNPCIQIIGPMGVVLFFVLSGFLITYLLVSEKLQFKTISLRDFYIRRALRIWPLYYVCVFAAFFVLPCLPITNVPSWSQGISPHLGLKLLLYLCLLPNLCKVVFPLVPFAGQLWSIGVEEQFYLMWPLIVRRRGNPMGLILAISTLYVSVRYLISKILLYSVLSQAWTAPVTGFYEFMQTSPLDCLAIGSLAALLLLYPSPRQSGCLRVLFSSPLQAMVYLITILLVLCGISTPILNRELYSLLFAVIILNLAANPRSIVTLDHWIVNHLGKLSYGMYMLHVVCIYVTGRLLQPVTSSNLVFYSLAVGTTVLASSCSYRFLERPFLKRKEHFSRVLSGDPPGG